MAVFQAVNRVGLRLTVTIALVSLIVGRPLTGIGVMIGVCTSLLGLLRLVSDINKALGGTQASAARTVRQGARTRMLIWVSVLAATISINTEVFWGALLGLTLVRLALYATALRRGRGLAL